MDGIKSNFDKIFEEFSNNTSHSIVPKRLSFNFLNNTSTYESSKNRKQIFLFIFIRG